MAFSFVSQPHYPSFIRLRGRAHALLCVLRYFWRMFIYVFILSHPFFNHYFCFIHSVKCCPTKNENLIAFLIAFFFLNKIELKCQIIVLNR